MKLHLSFLVFNCLLWMGVIATDPEDESGNGGKHKIEGRVVRPDSSLVPDYEWFGATKVYTNTGHLGLLKGDGTFVINNLPWGSHVIYVMNPSYLYESSRVDINSKGKIRARAVNNIQPSKVDLMAYPLRFKSIGAMKFFNQREEWKLTDFLFNPMVLMTLLPLVFMLILPRLNDPEARKEMEQIQMPKLETPELSEIMTNLFGGKSSTSTSVANVQNKAKLRLGKRKDK